MRVWRAAFEETFETHLKAARAKRRVIVHREVASKPPPLIFVTSERGYRLVGDAIVSSWSWSMNHNGVARERLFGAPIKPQRAKHGKGKTTRRRGQ